MVARVSAMVGTPSTREIGMCRRSDGGDMGRSCWRVMILLGRREIVASGISVSEH